jgi:hypothetical protein
MKAIGTSFHVRLELVPVHVAVGLTEAQLKAFRIADNQAATLFEWDDDKLGMERTSQYSDGATEYRELERIAKVWLAGGADHRSEVAQQTREQVFPPDSRVSSQISALADQPVDLQVIVGFQPRRFAHSGTSLETAPFRRRSLRVLRSRCDDHLFRVIARSAT